MPLTAAEQQELDLLEYEKLLSEKASTGASSAAPSMGKQFLGRMASAMTGGSFEQPSYTQRAPSEAARMSGSTLGLFMQPEQVAAGARAVPLGMAMANPVMSAPALLGPAIAAFGAELVQPDRSGRTAVAEGVKAFGAYATPIPAVQAGRGVVAPLKQAAKFGGVTAATEAGTETMRRSIEAGQITGYESLAEGFRETSLPLLFGAGIGGAGAKLHNSAEKRAKDDARKAFLATIGIEDPTLAMIRPREAATEEMVAATDGVLQQKIGKANLGTVRAAYEIVGGAPGNPVIAANLNQLTGVVDTANEAYGVAKKAADDAMTALAAAEKNAAALPPGQLEALQKDVQAKTLNAIQQQAASAYEVNRAFGKAIPNSVKAAELGDVIHKLMNVRSGIAADIYGRFFSEASQAVGAPINRGTPLFDKDAIVAVATQKLGADARTPIGISIVDTLKNAPAEKFVIGIDPTTGKPIEIERFTKAQIDSLRNEMARKVAGPAGTMGADDRAISEVYHVITDDVNNQLLQLVQNHPTAAKTLDEARAFVRTTSQLQDSPLGRAFLQHASGDVTNLADETIERVATGMAKGNIDELTEYKKFVAAIGNYNQPIPVKTPTGVQNIVPKAVAGQAMQTMADALENAFVAQNTTASGINYDGLFGDLLKSANIGSGYLPFPVETLGFGNLDTIRNWKLALRQFRPADVTSDIIDGVMQHPEARRIIENGGIDGGKVLKNVTAEEIYAKKVREQVALQEAGLLEPAKRAAESARVFATEQRVAEAAALSAYEKARANPILDAFTGKGSYKFTTTEGATGKGTITHFLLDEVSSDTAQKLMGALRKNNPNLASLVEQRVLADHLDRFVKTDPYYVAKDGTQGQRLNTSAIREYFHPNHPQNAPVTGLKARIGEPAVRKLESFLTTVAEVEADLARGRLPKGNDASRMLTLLGIATPPTTLGGVTGSVGFRRSAVDFISDAVKTRRYHVISAMVLDKSFASAVIRNADSLADAVTSLPLQKAYLVMANRPLMEELGLSAMENQPSTP